MIKEFLSNKIYRFLIIATAIYLIWTILYSFWILPDHKLDHFLSSSQTNAAAFGLRLINQDAIATETIEKNFISVDGNKKLQVSDSCNGLVLLIIYSGFILAFPAKLKLKVLFIPLGIGIILISNIIRIILLLMTHKYAPSYLNFNHHYTFTIIVYAIIFFTWYIFLKLNEKEIKYAV